jgi:hypothetical protein
MRKEREVAGKGQNDLGLAIFLFISCFLSHSDSIEPVRFNRLKLFETETEPDRVVFLFFNRFIMFFI